MEKADINKKEKSMTKQKDTAIQYIFTKDGFYPEYTDQEMNEKEPLELLYDMGLVENPTKLTISGYFLYLIAEAFFKELTALPELELARQRVKVHPSEETVENLLEATPYAIGTEFVDAEWIRKLFAGLEKIFQREINSYNGTVAMYLAERNQNLHVPERVFLHLVENKDEEFPFAFMATYASKKRIEVYSICLCNTHLRNIRMIGKNYFPCYLA